VATFVSVTVTMTLGVACFTASFGAYRNMTASYVGVFNTERVADLWVTGGDVEGIVAAASHDPAVQAAATRTQADLPITVGADKLRGVSLASPPPRSAAQPCCPATIRPTIGRCWSSITWPITSGCMPVMLSRSWVHTDGSG